MKITNIKIRKLSIDEKLKAIVSVTFDEQFALHDIKVIKNADKLFIAMPSRKTAEGKFVDIAHPITPEFRNELHMAIIKEYEIALNQNNSEWIKILWYLVSVIIILRLC